jgi:DNA polymerase III epsilon subunit-like protein
VTGRTRQHQPTADVARAGLWADTRIAVVDVETCAGEDGDHIVGIGIVTCRKATVTGSWSSLVNPGVPIDERSSRIHGITDTHGADEPSFAQLAPTVTSLLTPTEGERLVLAGHNVGFDVARLHLELGRIDLELADLPLLDTMKLPAVLDALGLVNPTHHDAASDAAATAQAVVALLEHAAHAGEDDLDALLRRTARRQTRTSSISPATTSTGARRRDDPDDGEPLPDDHTASHADLLPAKPTSKTLAAWRDALADCVALRCPYLPDRIGTAEAPGRLLLDELESALDTALTDGDAAGAATLLEAAGGLYRELDGRRPALAWYDRWAPRIAAVGRCTDEDDAARPAATDVPARPPCGTTTSPQLRSAAPTWPRRFCLPPVNVPAQACSPPGAVTVATGWPTTPPGWPGTTGGRPTSPHAHTRLWPATPG